MKYDPDKHHRRSIRLKDFDYAKTGAYFVTICTHNRECLFGDVINGEMVSNEFAELVEFTWHDLPNHNTNVILDQFIVMPNHVHAIIVLDDEHNVVRADSAIVGAGSEPAPTRPHNTTKQQIYNKPKSHGLPEIVRQFKTFSARRINQKRGVVGNSVWQRNYYEHIVRNEHELDRIREYIMYNSLHWEEDKNNPINIRKDSGRKIIQ